MKILIMGLSGAGKSELAKELHHLFKQRQIKSKRINGDEVRQKFNDWDFSNEGRLRQAQRIEDIAKNSREDVVIADFIAPTKETRSIFNADMLVWLDTVKSSNYANTDEVFQKPKDYHLKINKKDSKKWAKTIFNKINKDLL